MRTLLLLILTVSPAMAADVTATVNPESIVFKAGDAVITEYKYAGTVAVEKGEGTKPLAKPYFHPLHAPGGVKVTRDWPLVRGVAGETTDHFHQKSAWFCHGDVIPEGVELTTKSSDKHVKGVDFWSEAAGHGRIVCVKVDEPFNHRGRTIVKTHNEWRTPDDVVILKEMRGFVVTNVEEGYLIILVIRLEPVLGAVTFGDTKEGSLGVRVHDSLRLSGRGSTGIITTADGSEAKAPAKDNLPLWGRHSLWNDYSGTVDGKSVGISVFVEPSDRLPSAWHTRAYGLMAANPFARNVSGFPDLKGKTDLVKIEKNRSLILTYGIYMHTGDAKSGKVAAAYKEFEKSRPKITCGNAY